MELAKVCYAHPDPAICSVASWVCWNGVIVYYDGESYAGGRNRFDITKPCEMDGLCYSNSQLIQDYLNTTRVFEALGVPKGFQNYSITSIEVMMAFEATNDLGISTQPQILFLLENGIDTLIYQGNLDLACNTAGNFRWANNMVWKGQPEFVAQPIKQWTSAEKRAGWFKEVNIKMNDKSTRFSFVTHYGAGHMVSNMVSLSVF